MQTQTENFVKAIHKNMITKTTLQTWVKSKPRGISKAAAIISSLGGYTNVKNLSAICRKVPYLTLEWISKNDTALWGKISSSIKSKVNKSGATIYYMPVLGFDVEIGIADSDYNLPKTDKSRFSVETLNIAGQDIHISNQWERLFGRDSVNKKTGSDSKTIGRFAILIYVLSAGRYLICCPPNKRGEYELKKRGNDDTADSYDENYYTKYDGYYDPDGGGSSSGSGGKSTKSPGTGATPKAPGSGSGSGDESTKGKYPAGFNMIFYGAPGTGKSYDVRLITEGKEDELPEYLEEDAHIKKLPKSEHVYRTTFHPDSDYASFIGSYKPCMEGGNIAYKYHPQVFLNAYTYAWEHPTETVYLIIEEINRGNCAQIFGDIFQLLDRGDDGVSEFPIKPDSDISNFLKEKLDGKEIADSIKKGDIMSIPCNMFIIATLNTSDQSLFPMDSAFKRRWIWKYVKIDYTCKAISKWQLEVNRTLYQWSEVLAAINGLIREKKHSTDKQVGEFFVKADNDKISYADFRDKVLFYLYYDVFKGNRGFRIDDMELFEDLFTDEKAEEKVQNWLKELRLKQLKQSSEYDAGVKPDDGAEKSEESVETP